jgi:anti-sigma factor RsiW
MSECRDLEPLLAPYVDGEAPPGDVATIEAHVQKCPPCRDRVEVQRVARDVLHTRREGLRACASEGLRHRCEAHARAGLQTRPVGSSFARRTWVPLSLAATLLLAVAGVFLFGLNDRVEALAAQLALDHMKCFQFPPDQAGGVDARALANQWTTSHGWALQVPSSAPRQGLELIGVRRCLSTEGLTAHLMYRWRGQPLSVFVLNHASPRTNDVEQVVDRMGQEAVIWSQGNRTYAVVAKGTPSELEPVVRYVRSSAR